MYFATAPLSIVDRPADDRHLGRGALTPLLIVVHATGGTNSLEWLTTHPASEVSVHRLISRDGTIYKLAENWQVCNHVGFSQYRGIGYGTKSASLNTFALGIELENLNTGKQDYPSAQLNACAKQIVEWFGLYGPLPVVGHGDIDTRGKRDPMGLNWYDLWSRIREFHPRHDHA